MTKLTVQVTMSEGGVENELYDDYDSSDYDY